MARLIVVAEYNTSNGVVGFMVAPDAQAAMQMSERVRARGHIVAVGAINYEKSKENAYLQLKQKLKEKLLEKAKAKI